ncbi:MAG: hypothetical protein L6R37_004516 [Teloschistes peruensis]|nr:MAG: hypothetical protein L6R37_004516 [Teloschistes peruensis]
MLAVPIDLIWSLQMPSRRKVGIITAFYIRTPVLAFTLARNHYVHLLTVGSDAGLISKTVIIWQEVELTYSIAAATLMCLKPLVKDFNTSFGLGGEMVRTHAASGYILSNGDGSRGMDSQVGRLRRFRSGGKYGKGSVVELESRGDDSSKNNHVVVTEHTLDEISNLRPHANSRTTTMVSHDPTHRQHSSNGSQSRDDIVITHRVEQSVSPRHMV